MSELLQVPGALLILGGFAGAQLKRLTQDSWIYLTANAVGSSLLAIVAFAEAQWGFLLLEGTWAIVSAFGIGRRFARTRPSR
jgi:hypothetical protein